MHQICYKMEIWIKPAIDNEIDSKRFIF